jgi:peptidoglycan/LPS O-acetylase OafA/YrhL
LKRSARRAILLWGRQVQQQTIQDRVVEIHATNGFDYLRLGLAVAVVSWHGIMSSYGRPYAAEVYYSPWGTLFALILPMFFALSGFLVSGSLNRSRTIEGFLTLRALRIVPALAVEVLLCALILGPLLTTRPLGDYFAGQEFAAYFLNIAGIIHFALPGVFEELPRAGIVNLSLWTIPYELECYIAITALTILGLWKRRAFFILVSFGATILWPVSLVVSGAHSSLLALPGPLLVIAFLAGVSLYLYRDKIPLTNALAASCALCSVSLLAHPLTESLAVWPIAYVTIWLGLSHPPKVPVLMSGDYSYGVYLFAFPIQQAVMLALPEWREWWVNIGIALPLAFLYAAFSWHCIEKPILGKKKRIVSIIEALTGSLVRRRSPKMLSRSRDGLPTAPLT